MRKRSKYRPRPIHVDNINYVISGFKKAGTLPDIGVNLKLKNHEALDSLVKGTATKADLEILIEAFNMAEAMYKNYPELGAEWSREIRLGQDALLALSQRGLKTNHFIGYGPELLAIRQTMEIHDAQLDECTVAQMEKSLRYVWDAVIHKRTRQVA